MEYTIIDLNSVQASRTYENHVRAFKLTRGDTFTLSNEGCVQAFNLTAKEIKLGKKYDNMICTGKQKRKWWKIWKPKYISATFMYDGEIDE